MSNKGKEFISNLKLYSDYLKFEKQYSANRSQIQKVDTGASKGKRETGSGQCLVKENYAQS